jgi:hypothetical protein
VRDANTDVQVSQAIQISGALLVLAAFAAAQARIVNIRARAYLLLNFAGALALALSAAFERQWGFLLLNGVWSVVAAIGLATSVRRRRAARVNAR